MVRVKYFYLAVTLCKLRRHTHQISPYTLTRSEFNKCVDMYSDGIYRFVLKNMRDEDNARDVVQDTFEKVWKKVDEVPFEKAKSYLFTAAYRTMLDKITRNRTDRMEESHLRLHTTNQQYTGAYEALDKALNKLPEVQRTVIMLRDYEGYNYEAIGEITGLSESQVKVYIFRARTFLKNYLVSIDNVL